MTVFNAKPFLSETLSSLLTQDYDNFEIVISDNASTDGSSEICEELARQDPRIKHYRNAENVGAVKNWNNAFTKSNGEYFMWASDHDRFSSDYLRRGVEILDADKACTLVYAQTESVDYYGKSTGIDRASLDTTGLGPKERFRKVLWGLKRCSLVHGVQRTSNLTKLGGFPNSWAMDMALIPALSALGTFHQIEEPLYSRRDNRPPDHDYQKFVLENLDPGKKRSDGSLDKSSLFKETRTALLALLDKIEMNPFQKIQLRAMVYNCYWSRWGVGLFGLEHAAKFIPKSVRRSALLRPKPTGKERT